jgi:hypothetical protein
MANPKQSPSFFKKAKYIAVGSFLAAGTYFGNQFYGQFLHEKNVLKQMVSRLEAQSRVAEVLVTSVQYDEAQQKTFTTIKFLEYDTRGNPLAPKYFTFLGNIIQFQSLVIRFDDIHIRRADRLKGKSAFLFWKVFMLDGKDTQEFEINQVNEVPDGYKIEGAADLFEESLWREFWEYAFDAEKSSNAGIKNVQLEAPGTMFIPGYLYTIKIEHDGGLRIDTQILPKILNGETIPAG